MGGSQAVLLPEVDRLVHLPITIEATGLAHNEDTGLPVSVKL
jgi:hypothetical protein